MPPLIKLKTLCSSLNPSHQFKHPNFAPVSDINAPNVSRLYPIPRTLNQSLRTPRNSAKRSVHATKKKLGRDETGSAKERGREPHRQAFHALAAAVVVPPRRQVARAGLAGASAAGARRAVDRRLGPLVSRHGWSLEESPAIGRRSPGILSRFW
jgi:hypothetical protein